MFEAAELGSTVSKQEYRQLEPALRAELLKAQRALLESAAFPVIIVFAGVDGAGKGETVNLLHEWMDPRWLVARAFGKPSEEEQERPEYWRYWLALPPDGHIGLFLSSWYSKPVLDAVYGRIDRAALDQRLDAIAEFEKALADDGALILKFWMHLGRTQQKKRLKSLERNRLTRWRVSKLQWKHWKMYDRFVAAAERTIQRTSTGQAPWRIVEGVDEAYRSLAVGRSIRDAIRSRLADHQGRERLVNAGTRRSRVAAPARLQARRATVLSKLDMSGVIGKHSFATRLEKYQGRLNTLQREASRNGFSTILVFEGWDAAGKGGAIRRVTAALDARDYQVIPIAAPTDEERAHHYLWRFWRHLPRAGRLTIFDRSWYGRVLVERVEGLAARDEWMRAYAEINQFEQQLADHDVVLVKYWLHVTPQEQLRRFRAREKSPYKQWKLTDEDWRNRRRWTEYELAVDEMVERTSTRVAPWTLIAANDKYAARIQVLKTVCDRLQRTLRR
jgi:polyphosphate:AMP phosphotransferase